ncbi:MAG: serine aminopeptidase domain-containing protein [Flammeovirgaceae bacterium]
MVAQAEAFVKHITDKYEEKNVKPRRFLVGHSFGGTIAFKVNLRNPNQFSGVIFLVPALR